jgi:hypothetical protein
MPNNPSKKYCNSACYQENRSKKNNESFFTSARAKVKGKRSHDTLSSPAGSGFAANNASKKAKLGQGGVATEFEEIVSDPDLFDPDCLTKEDILKKLEHPGLFILYIILYINKTAQFLAFRGRLET